MDKIARLDELNQIVASFEIGEILVLEPYVKKERDALVEYLNAEKDTAGLWMYRMSTYIDFNLGRIPEEEIPSKLDQLKYVDGLYQKFILSIEMNEEE